MKRDGNGLRRMDRRLRFADDLPYDNHPVTTLVVVDALGHGSGAEHVLAKLRSHFWIVKGTRLVRNIVNSVLDVDVCSLQRLVVR
ncbi:hypothetical protein P5673_018173 [Acropora cervicornis]|uniref:Uncharacterized protein n=1 Tax=Acropora cervicornis TaxID=6130 RepID=A0AAD9QEP6_ACRCE|nr:hypothetical protein P5673_018173 [Acropora cervicornis]